MIQVDGLPGPSHTFGGLSPGNLASHRHAGLVSSPRRAARQAIAKMRVVAGLGLAQTFLPPLPRPDPEVLARLGGDGGDLWVRRLLHSSAAMWTANAATAARGDDGRLRLLVANLAAMPHRQQEACGRARQLAVLLPGVPVLEALPSHPEFGDEGAANHHTVIGPEGRCEVFVWGREAGEVRPGHPARQTRAASAAAARRLGIGRPLLVRQHPAAIDAGAFHNDVVMVGEGDRLLLHPQAWVDQAEVLAELRRRCGPLWVHEVQDLSLAEAVASYLFNAQLLSTPAGWVLVAPEQCQDGPARRAIARVLEEGFVEQVCFVPLGESMAGGGGPACLRLRVPVPPEAVAPGRLLDEASFAVLEAWVDRHYRDRLSWDDLGDPDLAREGVAALDDLARHGLSLTTPLPDLPCRPS